MNTQVEALAAEAQAPLYPRNDHGVPHGGRAPLRPGGSVRHRVRYVGEPAVPVNDSLPKCVAFVCATVSGSPGLRTPIGTGFFVGVPASTLPSGMHWYLVTARHVVAGVVESYVRVRMRDGLVDLPVQDWLLGATEAIDVAVAPFSLPPGLQHLCYSRGEFLSSSSEQPYLGDNVYFIGLLAFVPEMHEANIPMVRSGTLGAMYQSGVPVQTPDGRQIKVEAHLIDCRSYAGFSGSPCLVQSPLGTTQLLGVVGAHFDSTKIIRVAGENVAIPIHAGVGVVTPVERLVELLDDERLVEMRREAELRVAHDEGTAATLDLK